MYVKATVFVLCVLVHINARAQNLLPNGGFEEENICTEYHVNCAPEAWISTAPSYWFYFKEPALAHGGAHVMGILAGHSKSYFKRTFIRARLVCSLQRGHQYQLSFYIRSRHNILDSAGVYFTSYDFLFEKNVFHKIAPTVYLADADIKPAAADTGWQKVVIKYTATGEENFISLGYFAKNDLKGSTGIYRENNFLFLLDDLSLIALDPKEKICPDWRSNLDTIYAQNERHEYLDLIIRLYRYDPPHIIKFTATALPAVPVAPLVDTLIIPDILFATGSAVLSEKSHPLLDSFCAAISHKNIDSVLVNGHTDSVGSLDYNTKLSAGRASAVADYIKQKKVIEPGVIRVTYFAYFRPIASNHTAQGRQKNRRVEILLYRHK